MKETLFYLFISVLVTYALILFVEYVFGGYWLILMLISVGLLSYGIFTKDKERKARLSEIEARFEQRRMEEMNKNEEI